jgi:hypothetical protein
MPPFDTVIIGSNTDPKFLDFWPYVRRAWLRLFPEASVQLALVAAALPEPLPEGARWFKAVEGVPVPNQAKLARYFLACLQPGNTVCTINDIDLIPISKQYIEDFLANRPKGCLVTLGAEMYTSIETGKATSGYLTAEAPTWRTLANPNSLEWEPWIRSFIGFRKFDHKEDIANAVNYEHSDCFSDESWLRAMRALHPVQVQDRARGYHPYQARALMRPTWEFNAQRILDGTIVEAHLLRPLSEHREKLNLLFNLLGI